MSKMLVVLLALLVELRDAVPVETLYSQKSMFLNLMQGYSILAAVSPYDPITCQNHGKVNAANPSICDCPPFTDGRFCEETTCAPAGIRMTQFDGCACAPGYHGIHCEPAGFETPALKDFDFSKKTLTILMGMSDTPMNTIIDAAKQLVQAAGSFANEFILVQYSYYTYMGTTVASIDSQKFVGANAQSDALLALNDIGTGSLYESNLTNTYEALIAAFALDMIPNSPVFIFTEQPQNGITYDAVAGTFNYTQNATSYRDMVQRQIANFRPEIVIFSSQPIDNWQIFQNSYGTLINSNFGTAHLGLRVGTSDYSPLASASLNHLKALFPSTGNAFSVSSGAATVAYNGRYPNCDSITPESFHIDKYDYNIVVFLTFGPNSGASCADYTVTISTPLTGSIFTLTPDAGDMPSTCMGSLAVSTTTGYGVYSVSIVANTIGNAVPCQYRVAVQTDLLASVSYTDQPASFDAENPVLVIGDTLYSADQSTNGGFVMVARSSVNGYNVNNNYNNTNGYFITTALNSLNSMDKKSTTFSSTHTSRGQPQSAIVFIDQFDLGNSGFCDVSSTISRGLLTISDSTTHLIGTRLIPIYCAATLEPTEDANRCAQNQGRPTGLGSCQCNYGYGGTYCEYPLCFNGARFNRTSNTCQCDTANPYLFGSDCSYSQCNATTAINDTRQGVPTTFGIVFNKRTTMAKTIQPIINNIVYLQTVDTMNFFGQFVITTVIESINITQNQPRVYTDVETQYYSSYQAMENGIVNIKTTNSYNRCVQPMLHGIRSAITSLCYDGDFGLCPAPNDTSAPSQLRRWGSLFAFTDAPLSESEMQYAPYVIDLAYQNLIAVSFILTPINNQSTGLGGENCTNPTFPIDVASYNSYYQLAEITGGIAVHQFEDLNNLNAYQSNTQAIFQELTRNAVNSSLTFSYGQQDCTYVTVPQIIFGYGTTNLQIMVLAGSPYSSATSVTVTTSTSPLNMQQATRIGNSNLYTYYLSNVVNTENTLINVVIQDTYATDVTSRYPCSVKVWAQSATNSHNDLYLNGTSATYVDTSSPNMQYGDTNIVAAHMAASIYNTAIANPADVELIDMFIDSADSSFRYDNLPPGVNRYYPNATLVQANTKCNYQIASPNIPCYKPYMPYYYTVNLFIDSTGPPPPTNLPLGTHVAQMSRATYCGSAQTQGVCNGHGYAIYGSNTCQCNADANGNNLWYGDQCEYPVCVNGMPDALNGNTSCLCQDSTGNAIPWSGENCNLPQCQFGALVYPSSCPFDTTGYFKAIYSTNTYPNFGKKPRSVAFVVETTQAMSVAIAALQDTINSWVAATASNFWFDQYVLVVFGSSIQPQLIITTQDGNYKFTQAVQDIGSKSVPIEAATSNMVVNGFGAVEIALQAFDNTRGFVFVLTATPPSSTPSTSLHNLITQKNPEVHVLYASSQPDANALTTWRLFAESTNGDVVNAAQTQEYTYQYILRYTPALYASQLAYSQTYPSCNPGVQMRVPIGSSASQIIYHIDGTNNPQFTSIIAPNGASVGGQELVYDPARALAVQVITGMQAGPTIYTDLYILMDSSESVTSDGFTSEMVFAKTLVSNLPISGTSTRVSFYSFNDQIVQTCKMSISVGNNADAVMNGLNNCAYVSGTSNPAIAFNQVIQDYSNNGRSGVPLTIIFMSDGFYNSGAEDPNDPATTLRNQYGAGIITIGIKGITGLSTPINSAELLALTGGNSSLFFDASATSPSYYLSDIMALLPREYPDAMGSFAGVWTLNATGTSNGPCWIHMRVVSDNDVYAGFINVVQDDFPSPNAYYNRGALPSYTAIHAMNTSTLIQKVFLYGTSSVTGVDSTTPITLTINQRGPTCSYELYSSQFDCNKDIIGKYGTPNFKAVITGRDADKYNFYRTIHGTCLPYTDPSGQCSGHGTLSGDTCVCDCDWEGADCNVPACTNGATPYGDVCVCPPGTTGTLCMQVYPGTTTTSTTTTTTTTSTTTTSTTTTSTTSTTTTTTPAATTTAPTTPAATTTAAPTTQSTTPTTAVTTTPTTTPTTTSTTTTTTPTTTTPMVTLPPGCSPAAYQLDIIYVIQTDSTSLPYINDINYFLSTMECTIATSTGIGNGYIGYRYGLIDMLVSGISPSITLDTIGACDADQQGSVSTCCSQMVYYEQQTASYVKTVDWSSFPTEIFNYITPGYYPAQYKLYMFLASTAIDESVIQALDAEPNVIGTKVYYGGIGFTSAAYTSIQTWADSSIGETLAFDASAGLVDGAGQPTPVAVEIEKAMISAACYVDQNFRR